MSQQFGGRRSEELVPGRAGWALVHAAKRGSARLLSAARHAVAVQGCCCVDPQEHVHRAPEVPFSLI